MTAQITKTLEQVSEVDYLEEMDDGGIFDGIYYSLRNPDVITSNYSPLEHFNKWGKLEGRGWRRLKLSKSLSDLINTQKLQLGEQEITTP